MRRYKNHLLLALVLLIIAGLLASDSQLSKPLILALSIVSGVTALLGIGFGIAWRVHKRKQDAALAEFDDVR